MAANGRYVCDWVKTPVSKYAWRRLIHTFRSLWSDVEGDSGPLSIWSACVARLQMIIIKYKTFIATHSVPYAGFKINARPLARGDWKPRGMSRIFAQYL